MRNISEASRKVVTRDCTALAGKGYERQSAMRITKTLIGKTTQTGQMPLVASRIKTPLIALAESRSGADFVAPARADTRRGLPRRVLTFVSARNMMFKVRAKTEGRVRQD